MAVLITWDGMDERVRDGESLPGVGVLGVPNWMPKFRPCQPKSNGGPAPAIAPTLFPHQPKSYGQHLRRTPDRPSGWSMPTTGALFLCHGSQDLSPTQPTLRARRLPRVFPSAASLTALPETTEGCQACTTISLLFAAGRGANVLILRGLVGAWHLGLSNLPDDDSKKNSV
ncbi:predicted protein [Verticillium alfalfae VaMs.102]|uniref:Predicted protein n=1 Tax=Verticillium alfalfae (strain VaMs.102 / ATCC MYA-4576 / FGSC 10136) TaxID=526221 RepID=C9SZ97_VERA1|nr:predicted protein [Verticillium alfalfae VaMs.102]EEY24112.1 predicted protein [Verticillium alfalfae VaMs.102]